MRPKSMATVVVVLPGTARVSSTTTLSDVMGASVVSGSISDTAVTSVVLPTPKPPATSTLTGTRWGPADAESRWSAGAEGMEHLLEGRLVGAFLVGRAVYGDDPGRSQVTDQDAYDAIGQAERRRHLH